MASIARLLEIHLISSPLSIIIPTSSHSQSDLPFAQPFGCLALELKLWRLGRWTWTHPIFLTVWRHHSPQWDGMIRPPTLNKHYMSQGSWSDATCTNNLHDFCSVCFRQTTRRCQPSGQFPAGVGEYVVFDLLVAWSSMAGARNLKTLHESVLEVWIEKNREGQRKDCGAGQYMCVRPNFWARGMFPCLWA